MEKKGDSRYPHPDELDQRRRREARRAAQAAHEADQQAEPPAAMSGLVVWLARRLRMDPYELAAKIPGDTLRRTKYPFSSEAMEDGSTRFRSVGIVEDKQVIHAPTSPGSRRDQARGGIEVKR